MTWLDTITLAARSVGRRFGRSVLTVLAVALAATLLVALLTIERTAQTRVLNQLAKGGALSGIKVAPAQPDPDSGNADSPGLGARHDIDDAVIARIRALPGVRHVSPVLSAKELVLVDNQDPWLENEVGVDVSRSRVLPITVITGRLPSPRSSVEIAVTEGFLNRVRITKARAAEVLGTEVQLGAPRRYAYGLRPRWRRALIVGVVVQESGSGRIIAPIEAVRSSRRWTAAGVDRGRSVGVTRSPYSGVFVIADGVDQVGDVREQLTAMGYASSAPENLIATVRRYLHVVEIVLAGIGLIALVIAALGIANALVAAVRERRREIGVLKALGARDRDVARLFLVEASWLGLAGGLLGTIAGWLTARTVGIVVNGYLTREGLEGVTIGLRTEVLVGGTVGSMLLAVGAGIVPALRAARLPAREAVEG